MYISKRLGNFSFIIFIYLSGEASVLVAAAAAAVVASADGGMQIT
jgi:hypothetical protein